MQTIEHIPISEVEKTLRSLQLPSDTRVTLSIEVNEEEQKHLKKIRALEAMEKLKGSGSGNLVETLLEDRKRDSLL
jgi:hypothetical protein